MQRHAALAHAPIPDLTWEVLVVEVVKFGEKGVKQGELPLEIGAD